jgi:hypothetical protein
MGKILDSRFHGNDVQRAKPPVQSFSPSISVCFSNLKSTIENLKSIYRPFIPNSFCASRNGPKSATWFAATG